MGEARNTIKHFQVIEKNYEAAWENLKGRYSHKRLIVNAILKRLFTHRKITTQSTSQLKSLIDNTKECLNSLNGMDIPTDSWDHMVIYLTVHKLDQDSHNDWEKYVSDEYSDGLPTLQNLVDFLERRIRTLEVTVAATSTSKPNREPIRESSRSFHVTTADNTCTLCKEDHYLCHCKEFGKLNPEKRSELAREHRLCYNCLAPGHSVFNCKQKTSCRICRKRHHTLLHQRKDDSLVNEDTKQSTGMTSMHTNVEEDKEEPHNDVYVASHFTLKKEMVLLATALIPVKSNNGTTTLLRALIDPGSQASFISERATQLLKLKRTPSYGNVTGVGSTQTTISHAVQLQILSRHNQEFCLDINAYVLSTQLTSKLPSKSLTKKQWPHLEKLNLADPNYHTPGHIDMLLGVEVYQEIVKNNLVKGPPGTPTAQETDLGWILFGSIDESSTANNIIVMHHNVNVDNMLRSMWEIDMTHKRNLTAEERLCEDIYTNTQTRTEDGRYVVKLQFKHEEPLTHIGETKSIAEKRFHQLERRFEQNTKLKEDYTQVIEEYITLNHMEEVPEKEKNDSAVYLPHHAVVREDKETTKTRVVFNASCKGSNNASLNDQRLV
ncbi:hypothetical protein JYU34_001059 [Plutella xylostella]|uniref:Peptidase aspartic putative domain-containing protein n=1 Tax=Plutella xylostella TaxID=51655 RepID=A0ABQ7R601_PLUXY|nr:hypothetical protein JYU34_001059 [Plutella xylostella]